MAAKVVSLTGCLMKGDEPSEVWLEEKGGKIYGLESSQIKLTEHLGHKVTVTGHVLAEGKRGGRRGSEGAKQNRKT
jgi:hypothetical protein